MGFYDFEFRVFVLLDWLPDKARESSLYLCESERKRIGRILRKKIIKTIKRTLKQKIITKRRVTKHTINSGSVKFEINAINKTKKTKQLYRSSDNRRQKKYIPTKINTRNQILYMKTFNVYRLIAFKPTKHSFCSQ